jgi:hemerythrin-like metal-binding protein
VAEEKIVVQWQNSYSVGIRLVDEQHIYLIRLTNQLFNGCMASGKEKVTSTFLQTVHDTVEYTGYHFSTEEKIMLRVAYPDYLHHKDEHTDFVREVYSSLEEFKAGRMLAPLQFVYFLRDWVLHHIAVSDKKLGNFLIALKKGGQLQNMTLKVKKDEATERMIIQ